MRSILCRFLFLLMFIFLLPVAVVGLIAVMRRLGLLSDAALTALEEVASPAVLGGGRPVGALEPVLGT